MDYLFTKWAFVVLLALIGTVDSTALALGNREALTGRFALTWSLCNAVAHIGVKALTGFASEWLQDHSWEFQCGVAAISAFIWWEAFHSVRHHAPRTRLELVLPGALLGALDAVPMGFFKFMVTMNSPQTLLVGGILLFGIPLLALRLKCFLGAAPAARLGHFGIFSFVTPLVTFGLFMPDKAATGAAIVTAIGALVLVRTKRSHH